ncbi:MAG TPA: outer membrane beta-barrel protein [Polyangiaceae bacterium]|nr:outer membrane beta-barrel protein [Polyangiaceae bacterium]
MATTIIRAPRRPRQAAPLLGALSGAFLLCLSATSSAAGGVEAHDGFLLRLTLGLGYGSGTEEQPIVGDVTLSGAAGFFSLDLGGALTQNLVLHGRLSDMVLVNPTVSIGGEELGTIDDASLTFYLLGAGLTYYLMPANVYLTGVVGVTKAKADNGENTGESSDAGFGFEGDIGKEWWVSDNWGIGIAGRFTYASVPDDAARLNAFGLGVLFSATYQ